MQPLQIVRSLEKLDTLSIEERKTVTHLNFGHRFIRDFDEDSFAGLDSVRKIDLIENLFKEIPPGLFDQCPQLEEVDLSTNSLDEIPEGIFAKNKNLQAVYLNCNHLKALPPNMFHPELAVLSEGVSKSIIFQMFENSFGDFDKEGKRIFANKLLEADAFDFTPVDLGGGISVLSMSTDFPLIAYQSKLGLALEAGWNYYDSATEAWDHWNYIMHQEHRYEIPGSWDPGDETMLEAIRFSLAIERLIPDVGAHRMRLHNDGFYYTTAPLEDC